MRVIVALWSNESVSSELGSVVVRAIEEEWSWSCPDPAGFPHRIAVGVSSIEEGERVRDLVADMDAVNSVWVEDQDWNFPLRLGPDVSCPGCGRVNVGPHACPGPRAAPAYGGSPLPADAQCDFDVVLVSVKPEARIPTLKVIRDLTHLSLKEALALVDAAPVRVVGGLSKHEAEDIMRKVQSAGATVRVQ